MPVTGLRGQPRTKPASLQRDAGYSSEALTAVGRWLGIKPILAPLTRRATTSAASGTAVRCRAHLVLVRQLPSTQVVLRALREAHPSLSRARVRNHLREPADAVKNLILKQLLSHDWPCDVEPRSPALSGDIGVSSGCR